MIACKIENIIMQTPIFSISSEAFKRMVLKGKGAEGGVLLRTVTPDSLDYISEHKDEGYTADKAAYEG